MPRRYIHAFHRQQRLPQRPATANALQWCCRLRLDPLMTSGRHEVLLARRRERWGVPVALRRRADREVGTSAAQRMGWGFARRGQVTGRQRHWMAGLERTRIIAASAGKNQEICIDN